MSPAKIIKVDPLTYSERQLFEAAEALRKGKLVIVPTETVYGIAANALIPQTLERLYEIKKRPLEKQLSLHIEKKEKMEELARNIPVQAYKLADKFWPGPLTMVLKSKNEGTVGLRMPDHSIALRLIELSGVPVVCPSANISGKAAPRDFSQALADLEGVEEFAIDGGSTRLGIETSVVDLSRDPAQILREGAIKKEEIEHSLAMKNVLFICTGNSCRSVMAKALLEKELAQRNRNDVQVLSAGIMDLGGLSATEATKVVLAREGISVANHRSQRVTAWMVKKSDLILVMEKIHEEKILQIAPEAKNRVFLLKEFAKIEDNRMNIDDPIGRSLEFYEKTLAVIKEAVSRIAGLI